MPFSSPSGVLNQSLDRIFGKPVLHTLRHPPMAVEDDSFTDAPSRTGSAGRGSISPMSPYAPISVYSSYPRTSHLKHTLQHFSVRYVVLSFGSEAMP